MSSVAQRGTGIDSCCEHVPCKPRWSFGWRRGPEHTEHVGDSYGQSRRRTVWAVEVEDDLAREPWQVIHFLGPRGSLAQQCIASWMHVALPHATPHPRQTARRSLRQELGTVQPPTQRARLTKPLCIPATTDGDGDGDGEGEGEGEGSWSQKVPNEENTKSVKLGHES